MNNRREFLACCTQVALVAGAGWASLPWLGARPSVRALADISFLQFHRAVGSSFSIMRRSRDPVRLQLVEAKLAPSHFATSHSPECFSLLFRNSDEAKLSQDTYSFEHPQLGRFDLFIVPVPRANAGAGCYEAVFNRPAVNPSV